MKVAREKSRQTAILAKKKERKKKGKALAKTYLDDEPASGDESGATGESILEQKRATQ
jgi:hypothetical protein